MKAINRNVVFSTNFAILRGTGTRYAIKKNWQTLLLKKLCSDFDYNKQQRNVDANTNSNYPFPIPILKKWVEDRLYIHEVNA